MAGTAELVVPDAAGWLAWLAEHHGSSAGVWLVLAKTGTVEPTSLDHDQALEEALCHGWIDGQLRGRDSGTYCHRFSRRRPRSAWSRRNIEMAERLFAEGRPPSLLGTGKCFWVGAQSLNSDPLEVGRPSEFPGQKHLGILHASCVMKPCSAALMGIPFTPSFLNSVAATRPRSRSRPTRRTMRRSTLTHWPIGSETKAQDRARAFISTV